MDMIALFLHFIISCRYYGDLYGENRIYNTALHYFDILV